VVLDVGLPGLGGLEVCRRLRADPSTKTLPIVMLTGRDDPRDLRDGLLAGANAFLTKPFNEAELLAVVKQFTRP
jgi:DNA-binding response OmpR family regulator